MKRGALVGTLILTLALPLAGHSADEAAGKAAVPAHPTPLAAEPAKTPAAVSPTQPDEDGGVITGKVVQTMNSGGYTYICLENKGKRTWVAAPEMQVSVGQELTFKGGGEMRGFTSKSLNRTFENIFFCGPPVSQAGAAATGAAADKQSPGSKGAKAAKDEKIKVAKASGANAYTIGDLYKKKARLDKQKVVVRGKVVKVSARIMERNWIHLQDGSGNTKKGTHNLVVTSKDLPSVGDVVTASGLLAKDRDFGGGYRYDVILEQATVKTEK